MPSGPIVSVEDHGTIWRIGYLPPEGQFDYINFDHRQFAHFYEGATGGDFYQDYQFGHGREYISDVLKGLKIGVEGEAWEARVYIED